MKIAKTKSYVVVLTISAILLGGGMFYASNLFNTNPVLAAPYTSADNPVNPTTAPDSYVVNIPDPNLRAALNEAIAEESGTTRLPTAAITAGEMRTLVGVRGSTWDELGEPVHLRNKRISNLEGLQFLTKAVNIDLTQNQITNLEPLRELPELVSLRLENNRQLENLAPLATMPKLLWLRVGVSKVTDLSQIAASRTLQDLWIQDMKIVPAKLNLAPLAAMTSLKRVSTGTNRLNEADLAVLKNAPSLSVLMASGNDIKDLHAVLGSGFNNLVYNSTFANQVTEMNTTTKLFPNPIKGHDGNTVPIIETDSVKNADADGTLNPNGEYLKIVSSGASGDTTVSWNKQFSLPGWPSLRPFSGNLKINFNLDVIAPTFSPSAPGKITSRKGVQININDVTATDNVGGSGVSTAGVTNNASVINLNPNNPAAGNYTLTYSVQDNEGNEATVDRQIEITDADNLQTRVDAVDSAMLDGMTAETVNNVNAAKATATTVIANNASTQVQIDQALNNLNNAINALRANKKPLTDALADYNDPTLPDFIKNDPAVQAALAQATATNNAANPSVEDVRNHAKALTDALEAAIKKEQDAQEAARDGLQDAEDALNDAGLPADQMPNIDFTALEGLVNAVQDSSEKADLLDWLNDIKAAYKERQDKINANSNASSAQSNTAQSVAGGVAAGLAETGVGLAGIAGTGASAVAGGAWLAVKNRRQKR